MCVNECVCVGVGWGGGWWFKQLRGRGSNDKAIMGKQRDPVSLILPH